MRACRLPGGASGGSVHFFGRRRVSPADGVDYGPFDRDGDPSTFSAAERDAVILSWTHISRYFAMFDVNVTTDDAVRQASDAWGWILITEDYSGGWGWKSSAIGTPQEAQAVVGSDSIDGADRSRRVAHELGHNFALEHSGVWDGGKFYKWEDWPQWDGVYGPIMGGGGYGERTGWAKGKHAGDPISVQDEMKIIRGILMDLGSAEGWREDDFPEGATPMCDGGTFLHRDGNLERPTDEDRFVVEWGGGDLELVVEIPEVSAALPVVDLLAGGQVVGQEGVFPGLSAGTYEIRVRAPSEYAAIGVYRVVAR